MATLLACLVAVGAHGGGRGEGVSADKIQSVEYGVRLDALSIMVGVVNGVAMATY